MIKLEVYNKEGKKTGSQEVPETVFGLSRNDALVHQVYTSKLANKRRPYAHTKTRAEVRGGGRKPWRQKGTGRARHGSTRSPIWVGGGVTFGPRNDRVFSKKVNKKMNRKAIVTALSAKAEAGNIYVAESLEYPELKTKHGAGFIFQLGIQGKSAVVYGTAEDKGFSRVFRNLPRVKPVNINRLNILDILDNRYCIISKTALTHIINQYANTSTHIQKESGEGKAPNSEEKTERRKAGAERAGVKEN
ncbi:MAG: 50S ribosomal protein L4 [Candidatus Spechtbacterales bacterium]